MWTVTGDQSPTAANGTEKYLRQSVLCLHFNSFQVGICLFWSEIDIFICMLQNVRSGRQIKILILGSRVPPRPPCDPTGKELGPEIQVDSWRWAQISRCLPKFSTWGRKQIKLPKLFLFCSFVLCNWKSTGYGSVIRGPCMLGEGEDGEEQLCFASTVPCKPRRCFIWATASVVK